MGLLAEILINFPHTNRGSIIFIVFISIVALLSLKVSECYNSREMLFEKVVCDQGARKAIIVVAHAHFAIFYH